MNRTILLVEDEAIIALQEIEIISNAGFKTVHNLTGEEAIETVKKNEDISLILMDIDLGDGIDGTEAAEKILEFRDVPIVFLTSHSEKQMVDKVKNITKYGYVIKAAGPFVLIESIEMALELFNTQAELKNSEIEYREIVDGIDHAILKFDKEGRIIYFSKGAERIFGYKAEEVLGKLSVETVNSAYDSEGNNHEELIKDIFRDPDRYTINENENRTKDGKKLWMRWFNRAVFDHKGRQMYILCIASDMTRSRAAYKTVAKSENLFRNAFRNSPLMMSITRFSDGTYVEVNDEFLHQTGYTEEECIGRKSTELGMITSSERVEKLKALREGRKMLNVPIQICCKSGKVIECDYTSVIIDIDGEKHLLSIGYKKE